MRHLNRRIFVRWLSSLPGWGLLGTQGMAQSGSLSGDEMATLREVAGVVLPSALGKAGIEAVASGFVEWFGAYRSGAEVSTGYGYPRVQVLPRNPSARYGAQLREVAPQLSSGKREAIAATLSRAKVDRIPQRPDGEHVVSDLMSYFYASSDGQDYLYGVKIKRDECRGLANSGERPAAWS